MHGRGTLLSYFRKRRRVDASDSSVQPETATQPIDPMFNDQAETVAQPLDIPAASAQPETATQPSNPSASTQPETAAKSSNPSANIQLETENQPSNPTSNAQPETAHGNIFASLPDDIGSKELGPAQPWLLSYPRNPNITNQRYTKTFKSSWYQRHKWISYSIQNDKVYCFCCIFFSTNASGAIDLRYIQHGYNSWDKAIGDPKKGLDKHGRSSAHRQAEYMWRSYKGSSASIAQRLVPHRQELIDKNRDYFSILFTHVRYLVVQEIPYRHVDEHDESASNQGNYIELLKAQCETNPTFNKLRDNILKQYSIHKDYWSKQIFNEFVEIMADAVRNKIGHEISEAGMFFLIIDECKDKAGHEQLSLCVRFCSSSVPKERFLGLIRLSEDFSAAAIAEKVLPFLSILSSDAVFVGLTTDGASVLFGVNSGVATRLRSVYPCIVNIHCTAHRLNLVIGKLAIQVFPSTMGVLKQLHSCFNALKTADMFETKQREREEQVRKIPGFTEVRWESLFQLCLAVVERFQTILITLSESSQDDDNHALICAGLYHKMANSTFVEELLIFYKIISLLQSLSKLLQKRTINWHQACSEIRLTQTTLSAMENNPNFVTRIIEETKKICNDCSIPLNVTSALYETRSQSIEASQDAAAAMNVRVQSKVSRLANVVKGFFEARFSSATMKLLEGLDALDPTSDFYMSFETILPLLDHFGQQLEISAAQVEMEMFKFNSGQGLAEINHVTCPSIMNLLRLRNTIAVTSAEAERSFSCMNRVKSKFRNLLSDERTSDLTLLSFERDLTMSLDMGSLIDSFAKVKSRRVPLVS